MRPTPSGTFEVRWRELDPDHGGKTRRLSRNFASEDDAAQFLAEIVMANRVDDGLDDLYGLVTGRVEQPEDEEEPVAPGEVFDWSTYRAADGERVDFMFLVQAFVRDRHTKGRAPKTMAQYRDLWKKVYRDIGAQYPDALSVHGADDFLKFLGRRGETDSTVNAIRTFLSTICNYAIAKEYAGKNPFGGSDRQREQTPDPKAPTDDQAGALYRAALEHDMLAAVGIRLELITGSRPGEIPAFAWTDIDWARGAIRRHHAASTATGFVGVQIGDTKTHKDDRLPLDADTLGLLRLHREECEQRAAALGATVDEHGFIISVEPDCSRPMRPDALSKRVTAIAQQVAGAEWVRMKHLRKWAATTAKRLDPEAAQRRLSHDHLSTTERHYFAPDYEKDAAVTRFLAQRLEDDGA